MRHLSWYCHNEYSSDSFPMCAEHYFCAASSVAGSRLLCGCSHWSCGVNDRIVIHTHVNRPAENSHQISQRPPRPGVASARLCCAGPAAESAAAVPAGCQQSGSAPGSPCPAASQLGHSRRDPDGASSVQHRELRSLSTRAAQAPSTASRTRQRSAARSDLAPPRFHRESEPKFDEGRGTRHKLEGKVTHRCGAAGLPRLRQRDHQPLPPARGPSRRTRRQRSDHAGVQAAVPDSADK